MTPRHPKESMLICSLTLGSIIFLNPFTSLKAEIYKSIGPDGNPIYTDQQTKNNTEIKLNSLQTLKVEKSKNTPSAVSSNVNAKQDDAIANYYKALSITFPQNDTVFTQETSSITFVVTLKPNLMGQHYLQLTSGGKVVAGPQGSLSLKVGGLNRGTHTFTPQITTETGRVLFSGKGLTIHVKQHSPLHPNNANAPKSAPNVTPPASAPSR